MPSALKESSLLPSHPIQAIKLDSSNAPAYYNLGNALYMKNSFGEVISAYKEALKLNPESAECHFNIASAYNDMKELENLCLTTKKAPITIIATLRHFIIWECFWRTRNNMM